MKNILLTGGAGFFGTVLKEILVDKGFFVVSIDLEKDQYKHENFVAVKGDIRNVELLNELCAKWKFDAIYHCAAMLAHDQKNFNELWTSNVDGTQNMVDIAQKYNINKIVFTSTNCLFAQNFDKLVTEDEPANPVEIYGKSKLEAEEILLKNSEKVNSVIFRCPTIMDEGRLGLLGILFEFIDENRKLPMVGNGENKYQFIYAKDLVEAFILALDYNKTQVFNIGSDNVKSFNEVYTYVFKHSGSKSRLWHLPKNFMIWGMKICNKLHISPLGPYQYKMIAENFVFDTTKIKRELKWKPTLSNDEMLLKSFNYYHKNKEEIKNRKNVSAHREVAKMGIIKLIKWFC